MAAMDVRSCLFLPNEFTTKPPAESIPPDNGHPGINFPLQSPIPGVPLAPSIAYPKLWRAPCSTGYSHTKTPQAIWTMPVKLRSLKKSLGLWDNLKKYARYSDAAAPNMAHTQAPRPPNWEYHHNQRTWPLDLVPYSQVSRGASDLWGWYFSHSRQPKALAVDSEPAIQDLTTREHVAPINSLILTRYHCTSATPLQDGTVVWGQVKNQIMTNDQQLAMNSGAPPHVFYPMWGRGCQATRPDRAVPDNLKAGHNDRVLLAGPNPDSNLAICEDKPFWNYQDADYQGIFGQQASFGGLMSQFKWEVQATSCLLLRQIWGELIFYGASWGYSTNGRVIVIFVRTKETELTCSELYDVTRPDVIQVLAGLSFAAYDGRVREFLLDNDIAAKIRDHIGDNYFGYRKILVDPARSVNDQTLINHLALPNVQMY